MSGSPRIPRRDRLVDTPMSSKISSVLGCTTSAREVVAGRGAIDDPLADAMPRQLVRHRQAGRSRANHQHRKYRSFITITSV
jgi:hypothetical protein